MAAIAAQVARGDRAAAEAQLARARMSLRTEWDHEDTASFEVLARSIARLPRASPSVEQIQPRSMPREPADLDHVPFVGRADELAQLDRAWREVRGGATRVIAIEGPAGIGKTRLVQEAVGRIQQQGASITLWGVANEQTANQALGLLREAFSQLAEPVRDHLRVACSTLDAVTCAVLQHYVPELRQVAPQHVQREIPRLDGAAEGMRRRGALMVFLRTVAAQRPLLLILENGHR